MKTTSIKFIIMLVIMLIIVSFTVSSYAWSINKFNANNTSISGTCSITKFGNTLVGVITTIGIVASVIVLIIIGIRYMIGSIEEKAQYKKSMMPYIIGAGLVFSASTIANIIYNWAK